jgi:hypothetical protein
MTKFANELRHYCRNSNCRTKLPEPTANLRRAFCTRGCHAQFYRNRCLVCENELPTGRSDRKLCRRPKCRWKYRQNKMLFEPPKPKSGSDTARAHLAPKSPAKTGTFLRGLDGRAWRFEEDAGKWWLYDREGQVAVVFQREGSRFVIIKPHIVPEQSAATLEDAYRLAETIALWTLPLDPDTASRLRAANKLERVRRQTAWGRPNIPDAVESEATAVESHSLLIPDDLLIPDFLRRSSV